MEELFYSPLDPKIIKREREKARELRKTQWWQHKLAAGVCHYCQKRFAKEDLTMDHIVPVGRGGTSTKGNIVTCCRACNANKGSKTAFEVALQTF